MLIFLKKYKHEHPRTYVHTYIHSQANSRPIKDHGTPFAKHATRVKLVNIGRAAATPAQGHARLALKVGLAHVDIVHLSYFAFKMH